MAALSRGATGRMVSLRAHTPCSTWIRQVVFFVQDQHPERRVPKGWSVEPPQECAAILPQNVRAGHSNTHAGVGTVGGFALWQPRRCTRNHRQSGVRLGTASSGGALRHEADLSKRGNGLVVLFMGGERLDTRNPTSKLMLTILAGVATWNARSCSSGTRRRRQIQGPPGQHRRGAGNCAPSWDLRRSPGKLGIARSSVYRVLGAA